jgi:hypothetical protein
MACGAPPSDAEGETTETELTTADPNLASELAALTAKCGDVASKGKYATDSGGKSTVEICRLNGAFFWKADMDVDCDGQTTSQCNHSTDPWYQNDTSFHQSDGKPLSAAKLPYVVIPLPSSRFDYRSANIKPGAVVAVLYQGKLSFGVFGDEGPSNIIGESSYAMAKSLGIDPNPDTGGTDSGVTYIAFTGSHAVASPIESHAKAASLGGTLAAQLLANN